jgi:hypothetical protein
MSYESNLPPGMTASDIPGWSYESDPPEPLLEVQYFPVVEPPAHLMQWKERLVTK